MPDKAGNYTYYDTPDGKDGHKKAWYLCKHFGKLAVLSGTVDAFTITAAKTPLGVLTVYGRHMSIAVGTTLAFVCTTYISTDLRGKDDPKNHAAGALAASAVLGAAISSPLLFSVLALTSVPLLHANKTAMMDGINVWRLEDDMKDWRNGFPTPNWHTFEAHKRSITLKEMYDEKNEEYFRKRKEAEESEV